MVGIGLDSCYYYIRIIATVSELCYWLDAAVDMRKTMNLGLG
jgi:hypothetical protein